VLETFAFRGNSAENLGKALTPYREVEGMLQILMAKDMAHIAGIIAGSRHGITRKVTILPLKVTDEGRFVERDSRVQHLNSQKSMHLQSS
jgi:hypothetical protein